MLILTVNITKHLILKALKDFLHKLHVNYYVKSHIKITVK